MINAAQYAIRLPLYLLLLAIIVFTGCQTMESVITTAATVAGSQGMIDNSQADTIIKHTSAVSRSFEEFTPEQEYYIGRSVAAVVLSKYSPYMNKKANDYVNIIGQTVALASDLPETFAGYHFLILNSDEVNAFAAPGGLIFVTRGLLRCCPSEDAVAAVLAHEIGHTQNKHGLQAIKRARITQAFTSLALEGAKTFGRQELAQLTEAFEGTISDITGTMINNGYSRSLEYDADRTAVTILSRVGYDPHALTEMLQMMGKRLNPKGLDFAKTHPSPSSRVAKIKMYTDKYSPVLIPEARKVRFAKALANI
ncbi:MAG: M48 family metallopeptidase [Syntrophales bacterium]